MPIIGICADWDETRLRSNLPNDYVRTLLAAGAVPLILPIGGEEATWQKMADAVDGLLFPGGVDMDPQLYGEQKHPLTNIPNRQRDDQELFIMRYALESGKPLLAVCRGFQLLNCLDGGTLHQDIETMVDTSIDHAQFSLRDADIHEVALTPGTLLAKVMGENRVMVNSRHHQAVKKIGQGLVASAHAPDGMVEALEFADGRPCLAVQWHPESLFEKSAAQMRLFDWLTQAAEGNA